MALPHALQYMARLPDELYEGGLQNVPGRVCRQPRVWSFDSCKGSKKDGYYIGMRAIEDVRKLQDLVTPEMRALGERIDGLRERVDGLREDTKRGFEEVNRRFDYIERSFRLDERITAVEDQIRKPSKRQESH